MKDRNVGWEFRRLDHQRRKRQPSTVHLTAAHAGARRSQPVWAPDGSRLHYSLKQDGLATIHMKQTDGGGAQEKVLPARR